MSDEAIMTLLGREGAHPEGWFFPDTYRYHLGMSDVDILRQSLQRMERILEEVWAERDEDLTIESPYEALIMASLIERETGAPEERREIAGVQAAYGARHASSNGPYGHLWNGASATKGGLPVPT